MIIESSEIPHVSKRRKYFYGNKGEYRLKEYYYTNEDLKETLQARVHWGECEVASMMNNTGGSGDAADTYYQEAQALLDELWRRIQEAQHNQKLIKIICK